MKTFDIIIIGAGISGSLLFLELCKLKEPNQKILILDSQRKDHNDRIISFWDENEFPYPEIPYIKWNQVKLIDENKEKICNTENYSYYTFESIHLYNKVKKEIAKNSNFDFIQTKTINISEIEGGIIVKTKNEIFKSKLLFDARRDLETIMSEAKDATTLLMEFSGLRIKTAEEMFDVSAPVLFDFRAKQNNNFSFGYIVPFSKNEALIDYVSFSKKISGNTFTELKNYISSILGIEKFEVTYSEGGIIPLTNHKFIRESSHKVYKIGTSAGMIKPITGYGFIRMYKDAKLIARQVARNQIPLKFPKQALLYYFCDTISLKHIKYNPEKSPNLFQSIFKQKKCGHIFRFLDEKMKFMDIIRLGLDVPKSILLAALKPN